ncbi:MAG: hypothetical protein ACLGHN_02400 [Bacteriovoracia bacterium]
MTRTFSFLFLFLFLASCGKGGGGSSSSGSMAELTDAEIASDSVPVQAQTFDVHANLSGFSRDQEDKIYKAIELIKQVIATPEFKKKVLSKTYKGKKQYVDNNGLSNAQIYKKLLEGSEVLNPGSDNTMNLNLESYFVSANVIGYTKPSITTVYLNRKYLNQGSFTTNEVAMNLTHEWLHKLGFKHSVKKTASRAHSVPYAIGYIMRSLAAKYD